MKFRLILVLVLTLTIIKVYYSNFKSLDLLFGNREGTNWQLQETNQIVVERQPHSPPLFRNASFTSSNAWKKLNGVHVSKSILLPPPMELWRLNISLDTAFNIPPRKILDLNCSCLNPLANLSCCERFIRYTHKMGHSLTIQTFVKYRRTQLNLSKGGRSLIPGDFFPDDAGKDYRDVLVFRNIYAALKSGYLYHLTGRECWLNMNGRPMPSTIWDNPPERWKTSQPVNWLSYLSLPVEEKALASLNGDRTICHYLQKVDEKVGMKAYIDLVFHGYYYAGFTHWALANAFPEVRERTKHACYEDFLSDAKDQQTIEASLSFLFNQSTEWNGTLPGKRPYVGGHSTSHHTDPDQSARLLQIIQELDAEVFNNEIAWVDSVLPC